MLGTMFIGRPHGGGEGGSRIAQFCGRIRLIGCVKCGQGGGGSKIPKILWTSYVHGPLGDGPAASMDGPAAARMMLLHPNRMAASKEEEAGSSSQVRARWLLWFWLELEISQPLTKSDFWPHLSACRLAGSAHSARSQ